MSSVLSLHENFATIWTLHWPHMLTQHLILVMVEGSLAPPFVIQAVRPLSMSMPTPLTCMLTPMDGKMVNQVLGGCENLAAPWVITRVGFTWNPVHMLNMKIKLTLVCENLSAHRTHPAVVVNIKHVCGKLMEHCKNT